MFCVPVSRCRQVKCSRRGFTSHLFSWGTFFLYVCSILLMAARHVARNPIFRLVNLILILYTHPIPIHASLVREWGYIVANPALPDSSPIVQINTGGDHILALTSAGHLVTWGYNSHGQAVAPAGAPVFIKVAGGGYHSLALKPDGTV